MDTFDDVFSAFGGPARFAEAVGIEPVHAQTMKARGSIPPAYWADTVAAADVLAKAAGDPEKRLALEGVTLEALADLAKAKRHGPLDPPESERAAS